MTQSTHENFVRDEPARPGSDRAFGLVMAAALAALGLINLWHQGRLWPWLMLLAALALLASWLEPAWLHPLNRLCQQCFVGQEFGNLLQTAKLWRAEMRHSGDPAAGK